MVAFQLIAGFLSLEKRYLEACIQNPSADNMNILTDYIQKNNEYVQSLMPTQP